MWPNSLNNSIKTFGKFCFQFISTFLVRFKKAIQFSGKINNIELTKREVKLVYHHITNSSKGGGKSASTQNPHPVSNHALTCWRCPPKGTNSLKRVPSHVGCLKSHKKCHWNGFCL